MVKENKLCMNRLGSRHFVKEYPFGKRCKRCHQPQHLQLHIDAKSKNRYAPKTGLHSGKLSDVVVASVSQTEQHKQVLLMMCKCQILGPNRTTMQARALLDAVLLISLIIKCLVQ